MTDQCTSMCAHFDPYGGPFSKTRHVGDLGNLQTDGQGRAQMQMTDSMIALHGRNHSTSFRY